MTCALTAASAASLAATASAAFSAAAADALRAAPLRRAVSAFGSCKTCSSSRSDSLIRMPCGWSGCKTRTVGIISVMSLHLLVVRGHQLLGCSEVGGFVRRRIIVHRERLLQRNLA